MASSRIYLRVPYAEKDRAKAAGARWDASARSWYAPSDRHALYLIEWLPEPLKAEFTQKAADEEKRRREAKEWESHPPRSQDAAEIMRIAGLTHLRPVYFPYGFCGMCDSRVTGWYTDARGHCELRHLADFSCSRLLHPSELEIVERALDDGHWPPRGWRQWFKRRR